MTQHASGAFEVKMVPQSAEEQAPSVGRMTLDKQFHGDLEATSFGQMLAIMTKIEGSAGYVALEHVNGLLAGRKGGFALMHRGVMNRGAFELLITVIPDSGTEELAGLSGEMTIRTDGGNHFYEFNYQLNEAS